ncbi:hypothetical protein HC928_06530 [bacterium]|nr:hypothetical protein [bacterium]
MNVPILVGAAVRGSRPLFNLEDSLSELSLLADTAGLRVMGQMRQIVNQIDPATFIGSGKIEEVKAELELTGAGVVVFDDELSPRHQRELENGLVKTSRSLIVQPLSSIFSPSTPILVKAPYRLSSPSMSTGCRA